MSKTQIPKFRTTKLLLLTGLALTGIAMGAVPMAEAAYCSAHAGPAYVECYSNGPGACGAAAWAGASGQSGAGCMAADYP